MAVTKIQEAAGKLSSGSVTGGKNVNTPSSKVTTDNKEVPEKNEGKTIKEVSVPSSSDLEKSTESIQVSVAKPVDINLSDVDNQTLDRATNPLSVKKFLKSDPSYSKDYKEIFKKPRPAVLMVAYKDTSGNSYFEAFKLGITQISIQRADKAQVISTFGDSFLVQAFGRTPTSIAVEGYMISYGPLAAGWNFQIWWEQFLSFSSYYEGLLASRRYDDGGYITSALLHYNSVLYQCLFNSFVRAKNAQMHTIESVALSGIVLKSMPLPDIKVVIE